jgi:murein DD-endopeptidase MepM/ murein hydrolase activator NlpD
MVATGDVVKRGQGIGTVGSTGRASGPHLHFEVLKNGRHVDPRRYIAGNL